MGTRKSVVVGNVVGLLALGAVATLAYWVLVDWVLSDPDSEGSSVVPFVAIYVLALAIYLFVSVRYVRRPADHSGTSA